MKKGEIALIITVILLCLIILFSFILLSGRKPTPKSTLPPIQIFTQSPKPSNFPSASFSTSKEYVKEKISQGNYLEAREEYLKSHPWALKMPLKSDNYFITFNPETETFEVELYFQVNTNILSETQLTQAKQDALQAMREVGIDIDKQKINYTDIAKKQ